MKMRNILWLAFFASMAVAAGLAASCGSSSSDDDSSTSGDDTTSASSCTDAMTFMFGDSGCFTLKDSQGNVITPADLCGGSYADVVPCYTDCYTNNDTCPQMQSCLTNTCGLQLN